MYEFCALRRDFPAVQDVFRLHLTDAGHQAFAAELVFRKYRKVNQFFFPVEIQFNLSK
jgi:hypothetical protein